MQELYFSTMSLPIMNPSLLTDNELHEEYLIRGIKARGKKGIEQLVTALTKEASAQNFAPAPLSTMNTQVESSLVSELLTNFASRLEEYSRSGDPRLEEVLVTKFLHISGRVNRLAHADGEHDVVVSLVEQVSKLKKSFEVLRRAVESIGESEIFEQPHAFAGGGILRSPVPVNNNLTSPLTNAQPPQLPQGQGRLGNNSIDSPVYTHPSKQLGWSSNAERISQAFKDLERNVMPFTDIPPYSRTIGSDRPVPCITTSIINEPLATSRPDLFSIQDGGPRVPQPSSDYAGHADPLGSRSLQVQLDSQRPMARGILNSFSVFNDRNPHTTQLETNRADPCNYPLSSYQQFPFSAARSSAPPPSNFPLRHPLDYSQAPQVVNGRAGFTHQMAKWNLRFCGNDKDMWVDDFLFRAETLARSANIGLDALPFGMHYLLHEDAQDWF